MATINPEPLKACPPIIEELRERFCKKNVAGAESLVELAKSTGVPDLIKDCESFLAIVQANAKNFNEKAGTEGDNVQGDGTFYAAVGAGKKLVEATGGEW